MSVTSEPDGPAWCGERKWHDPSRCYYCGVAMDAKPKARRVDILCGCGWGLLAYPEGEVPHNCPVCGHDFGGGNE